MDFSFEHFHFWGRCVDKAKFEQFNLGELKSAQDILGLISSDEECSKVMKKQAEKISALLGEAIDHIRKKHKQSYYDLQNTIHQLRKSMKN